MSSGNASEFYLQERVCRALKRDRPDLREGIAFLQAQLSASFSDIDWRRVLDADWEEAQRSWNQWFDGLIGKYPPPVLRVLWFESPSSLADVACTTAVTGWTRSETADELYGADAPPVWPLAATGELADECVHAIPQLATVIERVWSGKSQAEQSEDQWDRRELAVSAIEAAMNQLLVQNGLPSSTLIRKWASRTSVGVLTGWKAAPDVYALGGLSPKGWGRMPAPSKPPPGEPVKLRPLEQWDPRAYLRRGGDPNYQHPESGDSLLHTIHYEEPIVEALVSAGIDLTLRNRRGETGLMRLATGSIKSLRLLLAKGADPTAVDNEGKSFVDHTIWRGGCTGKHLDFLVELGFKLPPDLLFRCVAGHGCYAPDAAVRIKSRLVAAIKHGFDINARNADGLTPLWVTLRKHKTFAPGPTAVGNDPRTYRYDLVAVMLLDNGADPNVRWPLPAEREIPVRATPLMLKSYWTPELVLALLRSGADPYAQSEDGLTALDYARETANATAEPDRRVAASIIPTLERAMKRSRS